ncbi:hypothetical protein GCM10009608_44150 [Pseudonocardia alaniniphila]
MIVSGAEPPYAFRMCAGPPFDRDGRPVCLVMIVIWGPVAVYHPVSDPDLLIMVEYQARRPAKHEPPAPDDGPHSREALRVGHPAAGRGVIG